MQSKRPETADSNGFLLFVFDCLNDVTESIGHFLECVVPTEIVRDKPVCQRFAVVISPTIPVSVSRAFNFPEIFLSAD